MELAGHKVGVVREFHNLHNVFVGSFSGENELLLVCARRVTLFNLSDVLRIHFVAVAEAFADGGRTVNLGGKASFLDDNVVTAKAHRGAQVLDVFLAREERNDRNFDVVRFAFHFDRTCALHAADVARKFHDGELHAVTNAEERDLVFAHIADDLDLAFDTAATETAWNDDCVDSLECRFDRNGTIFNFFRIDPADVGMQIQMGGGMCNRFDNRCVRIFEGEVLAANGNGKRLARIHGIALEGVHELAPLIKFRRGVNA